MARYTNELKLLIKKISLIDEEEENFEICLQFADSNFKYHRFLSPDSHEITRTLQGLTQKFEVHSQFEKAEAFTKYTNKFLSSPLGDAFPKSDTHYAVLKLLFCLADSPTNADYTPPPPKPLPPEQEAFDWKSYLMEGIDIDLSHFEQASSDEDEYDEDDEDNDKTAVSERHATFVEPVQHDESMTVVRDLHTGSQLQVWLEQHLVMQYWQRSLNLTEVSASHHESANLRINWESYLTRTSEVHAWSQKAPITEHHIIREFLWILSGVRDSYIFQWNGEKFVPNTQILVTHLTDEALQSVLDELCHYGTIVQRLHSFVTITTSAGMQFVGHQEGTGVSKTYQACANALSQYLQQLQQHVVQLEQKVCCQDNCFTVTSIMHELETRFTELNLLIQLLTAGVDCLSETSCNAQRASVLLTSLYRLLLESDHQLPHLPGQMSLLMKLWMKTLQPYISIIDSWISRGNLLDQQQEFIIRKSGDVGEDDEMFWERAFTIHCPEPRACADDGIDTEDSQPLVVPEFLVPILPEVVLTGKSMYLLECLGCLQLALSSAKQNDKRCSLFDAFVQSLEMKLGCHIDHEMAISPASLTQPDYSRAPAIESSETHGGALCPVEMLLKSSLQSQVSGYYKHVSTTLLNVFKQQHRLNHHLHTVQRFFLMEAGDVMSSFCSQICEMIRVGDAWQDPNLLNMALHEALQPGYQDDLDCLYVSVEEADKSDRASRCHLLDVIKLHYTVPWPISIILNSSSMKIYQQVFSFLLQIKQAKYSLENLRFADLERSDRVDDVTGEPLNPPSKSKIHRMHILRLRLLHFVNSLHQHIMTRILQASQLEFEGHLSEATDLDGVINAHQRYVSRLHQHSLLHERVKLIRGIISKVFDMALQFSDYWQQGAHSVSLVSLGNFETEFGKCLQFLSASLMPVVKRGLHPHLESLAFALVTSNQT